MLGDEIIDNVYVPDQLYYKTWIEREQRTSDSQAKMFYRPASCPVSKMNGHSGCWSRSFRWQLSQIEYLVIFSNESPRTAVFGGQVTFGLVGGLDFSLFFFFKGPLSSRLGQNKVGEREDKGSSSIHTKCIIIGSRESNIFEKE
jgi:hypothetical protein